MVVRITIFCREPLNFGLFLFLFLHFLFLFLFPFFLFCFPFVFLFLFLLFLFLFLFLSLFLFLFLFLLIFYLLSLLSLISVLFPKGEFPLWNDPSGSHWLEWLSLPCCHSARVAYVWCLPSPTDFDLKSVTMFVCLFVCHHKWNLRFFKLISSFFELVTSQQAVW